MTGLIAYRGDICLDSQADKFRRRRDRCSAGVGGALLHSACQSTPIVTPPSQKIWRQLASLGILESRMGNHFSAMPEISVRGHPTARRTCRNYTAAAIIAIGAHLELQPGSSCSRFNRYRRKACDLGCRSFATLVVSAAFFDLFRSYYFARSGSPLAISSPFCAPAFQRRCIRSDCADVACTRRWCDEFAARVCSNTPTEREPRKRCGSSRAFAPGRSRDGYREMGPGRGAANEIA